MSDNSFHQRTIRRPATVSGVGLHSGSNVTLTVLPAPVDSGISFVRTDLPERPVVAARAEMVVDTALATTLGVGKVKVATVEHLLAALAGLGIDNARIEVSGPEIPIMDGSSSAFVELISEAGVRQQDRAKTFIVIKRPVTVSDGDKYASLVPANRFRIDCTIDFKHPLISDQAVSLEVSDRAFLKSIARARTFGFLKDVEKLKAMGLARGGSLENAIVVDEFSILNPEGLRYPDEFARHKLLDALGDVSLLGRPVIGLLTCFKSGHQLNHRLVTRVLSDSANYEVVRARAAEVAKVGVAMADLDDELAPTAA